MAFEYYTISSNGSIFENCSWSKYNLAYYFYKNGNINANIEKNLDLAIKLFEDASSDGVLSASIELLNIYTELYIASGRNDINLKEKLDTVILQIQKSKDYNTEMKNRIRKNQYL